MNAPQPVRSLRGLAAGMAAVPPAEDLTIEGLTLDSRRAGPGRLFLAVPGSAADGRDYIPRALEQGVAAVFYESGNGYRPPVAEVPLVGVPELRRRVGELAARFQGRPSEQLLVIGITGTNGKTTCAHLTAQALERLGRRCGVVGTVGWGFPGALEESALTTPDAIGLQGRLTELLEAGADAVCMEVSSHALDQGRVEAVDFDIAVFTNLSRDHLDYHGDLDSYGAVKARLFDFPALDHAVINVNDPFSSVLAERVRRRQGVRLWSYGVERGDIAPRRLTIDGAGICMIVPVDGAEVEFRSPLLGRINVPNLLAVFATLLACGHEVGDIAAVFPELKAPPGRMELFRGGKGCPAVVVDYAHTPDALERALVSLREHVRRWLWAVFGCGGDRDRGKRPRMGAVAERLADRVILTDDNPRGEDPAAITDAIAAGMERRPEVIHDRRRAIEVAIRAAAPEDLVLVAGKGHEATQTRGGAVTRLSDREVVRELLGDAP